MELLLNEILFEMGVMLHWQDCILKLGREHLRCHINTQNVVFLKHLEC